MVTTPPPLNLLGHQQARLARLELAVGALSLAVLLLVSLGVWYVWHGLPIYYIPPGGPGLAQPGVIPDAAATDYASRWLRDRYTFTPATVKAMHAAILHALHPTLIVAFQAQAPREAALVKEVQLGTQMAVLTAVITHRTALEVVVSLTGTRTIWIGGQQVREEPVQAEITIVPWVVQGNPAGLVVAHVAITPPLTASGQ
jgi:hypothetical protein